MMLNNFITLQFYYNKEYQYFLYLPLKNPFIQSIAFLTNVKSTKGTWYFPSLGNVCVHTITMIVIVIVILLANS